MARKYFIICECEYSLTNASSVVQSNAPLAPSPSGVLSHERAAQKVRQRVYSPVRLRQTASAVKTLSLAEKLGTPMRESSLLAKATRLGLRSAALLESLGVARGCWHYRSPDLIRAPNVSESEFSNEELAVALLSPVLPYSPHTIRVGAAMLGATGNDVETICQLARAENCVALVRYIADAGLRFEPDNRFWRQLLDQLPSTPPIPDGVMPHPTRFVSMSGITRAGVKIVAIWIRPRPDLASAHG
jgi:hypothetical protein